MVWLLFLQGMVMDHDHLVVIGLRHRKPLSVLIDLMWLKLDKSSVLRDIRNRPQQGLFLGFVVQPDHEEFVMPMWIGEFHTAIHREFERSAVSLNSSVNLNPFISLVRASLGELAE